MTERTKTIRRLWEQLGTIRAYMPDVLNAEETIKLNRVCDIVNRYDRKAAEHLCEIGDLDLDAPFPVSILKD